MIRLILLAFLLASLFGQTINVDKSYVKFNVRNLGIRYVGGTITDMQGIVKFDSIQPYSAIFDVTVN